MSISERVEAPNPLEEGLRRRRTPEPCALTIFGASGDLTQRKLFPALYALAVRDLLPPKFGVVGVARTEMTDEAFREKMKQAIQDHARDEFRQDVWDEFAESIRYVATDFADQGGEEHVVQCLNELDEKFGTASNRIYYLAVPPSAIETIVVEMGKRRAADGWTRVIVEKPFGYDLETAQHLNEVVHRHFAEEEIFRIDHYLGKETVQNMLVLRFANGIFEPIWNRQFIDHVQITVAESLGIEGRADYYERAGAVRDIVQNHLLQLVALTAMEPPIDFTAESVRNEKVKVLKALHTPGPKHVVRGQYGPGYIEGEEVAGYREEPDVAPDSMTETFVAAKLYVDNWRWADTPFYIRTGKRLPRRETTIAIQFKRAPHPPFELDSDDALRPNVLLVHIQPDEGVSLAVGRQGARAGHVHPHGAHGLPLRRLVPHGPARGLRAPDPRLHARRRDALHALGRGRGAVGARGLDGRPLEARPPELPQLRGRNLGAGCRRRADPSGRTLVEAALTEGVTIRQIEQELGRLRHAAAAPGSAPNLRTSVMTHLAWVPERWVDAATDTLAGMGERHPSRTILLLPRPDDPRDALDGEVDLRCFVRAGEQGQVCSEVISLRALRPAGEGARKRGHAAAHPGPPGLPPLARRAVVRRPRAGPADGDRRPPRAGLGRVGRVRRQR